jgi:hypothetical protein
MRSGGTCPQSTQYTRSGGTCRHSNYEFSNKLYLLSYSYRGKPPPKACKKFNKLKYIKILFSNKRIDIALK